MSGVDAAVIGGGIVGTAAAAALAGEGLYVRLFERDELGAHASGRNSGAIQHPFDPELAPLWRESVARYEQLDGFELPAGEPELLLVAHEASALHEVALQLREIAPELEPELIGPDELAAAEPALARGLTACRIATGIPVPPASATRAFAELARRNGAEIETGVETRPWIEGGATRGVVAGAEPVEAGAVLVAAGPWIDPLVGAAEPVIAPIWGVNVEVALDDPPSVPVEQIGVVDASAIVGGELESTFSLVTARGASSLGSTFFREEPDADAVAPVLMRRGAEFVPALRDSHVRSTRACARPVTPDGRPLIGRVPGVEGLFVAGGHGPWGISTGPASAWLAADLILGRRDGPPPAFDPARFLGLPLPAAFGTP
ncbi:MAG: FAD-binding oxidoreductase [Actinomycetota bacterium]|nr:FAD-binding oxidoreductase [Actinomycetota bacterium]